MANVIVKEILHPDNDNNIDIYPKTSYDQVVNPPDLSIYQEKNTLEQDIESLGFNKVVGNPVENGNVKLTKIKIGNTIYLVPEGTIVEGNPSESGSVDLTKIKIGDTIYNIPSGGSVNSKLYNHKITIHNNKYSNICDIYVYSSNNTLINSRELFIQNWMKFLGVNVIVSFNEPTSGDAIKFIGFFNYFDDLLNQIWVSDYQNNTKTLDVSGLEYSDTVTEL